jgi:hypothetical protein
MKSYEYKGGWVMFLFVAIYVLSSIVFRCLFDDLPMRTGKGDEIYWYFIAVDFKEFLVNSTSLGTMKE